MPVSYLSPAHYETYGQYSGHLSDAQLSRYFYLDDFDLEQIGTRRRNLNRVGFAFQLVTVRFLGIYVEDLQTMPANGKQFVLKQLQTTIRDDELQTYNTSETFWDHQSDINVTYGYHSFHDVLPSYRFLRWLYTRTWVSSERPSILFDLSTAWLIEHKVLLPGVTVLERLVATVRERAEQRSWQLIRHQLNDEQIQLTKQLVTTPDDESPALFDELREMPSHNSSPQIRYHLDRLETLRGYELHTIDISSLSRNRLRTLADYALLANSSRLFRLRPDRRAAVIVAGMVRLAIRIQDLIVEMVNQWLHESVTQAKKAIEQKRLQSLLEFDQAAFQLRDFAQHLLQLSQTTPIDMAKLFTQFERTQIEKAITIVNQIEQPETSSYQSLVVERYRSARRFLPSFLRLLTFNSIEGETSDVLQATRFLRQLDQHPDETQLNEAPRGVISPSWRNLMLDDSGQLRKEAYTMNVLQVLLQQLRQRDVYLMPSEDWADPRQYLIDKTRWQHVKPQICRLLARHPEPEPELKQLSAQLDDAYEQTNQALKGDTELRMELINGVLRPISPNLDAIPDTPLLVILRQALTQRLPNVDLPDLMLEVHQMTRFADAFTHISERQSRVNDLHISLCAVLLAQGCNIGLEAVADERIPALTLHRLTWVQHHYVRPDTLREANRWLVQAQSLLRIAQMWGGGDIASADGLRFVVPPKALHGGFNRKYFGSGRGITFFNFMSNQFTGFHHIVIPGTLKEALFILDGLLDQTTNLQPTQVMTDTNSYTDLVFGLFWLLGFQFSPRLADIKDQRFWRMERQADYGVFNDISKHKISTKRVASDWDDMLRTAGSLKMGDVLPSQLMRIFSAKSGSTSLAKSIRDVGRIAKTLHMLHYLRDEAYQRQILTQLNHTEFRHKLARRLCYGNRGQLKHSYKEGQEEQLGALGLLLNILVYWNTYYLDRALDDFLHVQPDIDHADLARITPLAYEHIRILGRYSFTLNPQVQQGQQRELKPLKLKS